MHQGPQAHAHANTQLGHIKTQIFLPPLGTFTRKQKCALAMHAILRRLQAINLLKEQVSVR